MNRVQPIVIPHHRHDAFSDGSANIPGELDLEYHDASDLVAMAREGLPIIPMALDTDL